MAANPRRWLPMLLVLGLAGLLVLASQYRILARPHVRPAGADGGIEVYFSPHGGCQAAVVEQIEAARRSIDVQAYSFTAMPIAEALASARRRGVVVRVVMDREAAAEPYSLTAYLVHHGIPLYIDGEHPIAHNKVIVIDREVDTGGTVITGSFNFTRQADDANAENLLVIHGHANLVAAYEANFEAHLGHSERYR